MKHYAYLLCLPLLAGCGVTTTQSEPPLWAVEQPPKPVPHSTPVVKPDPKVATFRDAVSDFISEGKSICKLIAEFPEPLVYARKYRVLEELYLRIPDPPPGYEKTANDSREAKVALKDGLDFAKFLPDLVRLNAKEKADEVVGHCRKEGVTAQVLLNAMEKQLEASKP